MRKKLCFIFGSCQRLLELVLGFSAIIGLAIPLWQGCAGTASAMRTADPFSPHPTWGEYGGNLHLLQSFSSPPLSAGESNWFIDMRKGPSLRLFAAAHGLTNNHALFVFSHGRAIQTPSGLRYAFYPGKIYRQDVPTACFSIQDIARLLGTANAGKIHNLVLASCNRENMLSPQELRAYFPNVTNIVHATPGTDAQENTFRHALIYPSRDLEFLYEMPDTFTLGVLDWGKKTGKHGSRKAIPYVADLYLPGAKRPFATQTAGRELLLPLGG